MDILLELKKRFSPHGAYRHSLNRLKAVEKIYPDNSLVKEAISIIKKKMYCIPTPNSYRSFREHLIDRYTKELYDNGVISSDLWFFNGIKFHHSEYNNYVCTFIWEYIDIILNDSYLQPKLEQAENQNLSVVANVLSAFPSEGPYQYDKVTLNEGDVIIDAGANIGMFSLCAAKYYNCKCYAFEPSKLVIPALEKNIQTNSLDNNITVCPFGLSDTNGVVTFKIHLDNIGGSTIVRPLNTENVETENVQCISLDSWVEDNHIFKIDFIKADIEGAERLMLKGATNVLKNLHPKLSICTYHFPDDKQVLSRIIKEANPNYVIIHIYDKLYAYVPE
jgi:FkbM family methyltransferase